MPTKSTPSSSVIREQRCDTLVNGTYGCSSPIVTTIKWTNSVTYGENIPGWRDKIRSGQNATTSLNGTRVTVRYTAGRYKTERSKSGLPATQSYIVWYEGGFGSDAGVPSDNISGISESRANNEGLMKFNRQVLRVNTALQGGVFLGELSATLHGIRNPASGLRRLVDAWRRRAVTLRGLFRHRRQLQQLLSALGESWLEYSFHWRPLLSDIDAGCRALAEINTNQALFSEAVKGTGEEVLVVSSGTVAHTVGASRYHDEWVKRSHCQVVYRGAVRVNPRNSMTARAELLGFQPSQFIPTAWELLPYSFLIDYFTNIGDIIAGWSNLTANLSWCNRTARKQYEVTRTWRSSLAIARLSWPTVTSVSGSPSEVVITKSAVSRGVYTGILTPSFQFELPGFGSQRWLNIAALIANRRSDRSWRFGD